MDKTSAFEDNMQDVVWEIKDTANLYSSATF